MGKNGVYAWGSCLFCILPLPIFSFHVSGASPTMATASASRVAVHDMKRACTRLSARPPTPGRPGSGATHNSCHNIPAGSISAGVPVGPRGSRWPAPTAAAHRGAHLLRPHHTSTYKGERRYSAGANGAAAAIQRKFPYFQSMGRCLLKCAGLV